MHVSTGRTSGRRLPKAEREMQAKVKNEKEMMIKVEQELKDMHAEKELADVVKALDADMWERAKEAYMAGFRDAMVLRLERNRHFRGVLRETMAERAFDHWWASSR